MMILRIVFKFYFFFEISVSFLGVFRIDAGEHGFFGSDEDAEFLGSCHAGIKEVAFEHDELAFVDRHDDSLVFGALAFVDGAGVGEFDVLAFGFLEVDESAVEHHAHDCLIVEVGVEFFEDETDVSVVDILVVVVTDLHDAVTDT